ncbi:MAG: murein biosynthesis integral membrane protein MurJ [Pirellulales bacterium]|nr:murein biosynthesis integral membrane protein MurJ [Pirellulales bacterium]
MSAGGQDPHPRHALLSGTLVTSLGSFTSRVLGLLRDRATASLFGLAAGGVMDAFVVAFRIPNLFRRMFGEGALTASFLPVFAQTLERDRKQAWRVAASTMAWIVLVLAGLVAVGEIGFVIWAAASTEPREMLLAGLSAMLLPYVILACLLAIASASLQTMGKFAAPAFTPAVLNVVWMVGTIWIAPRLSNDPAAQARILAICVLAGGLAQCLLLWLALRTAGFRLTVNFAATRNELRQIRWNMLPTLFGLAVTQINTLLDSLLAWGMAAAPDGPQNIGWLGGIPYPMKQGAASAIYFGERLYQFPLGILGIAVATVVFPLLARHAARGDYAAVRNDLVRGMRLVMLLALPATAGLILLAEPIAQLLFQTGKFTSADTQRVAQMIAIYSSGVWAYCGAPVLIRGFYAVNDRITPVRAGLIAVTINTVLDITLMWPLAELGMAASTAIAAALQLVMLLAMFSRSHVAMPWRMILVSLARMLVATFAMALVGWLVLRALPPVISASHQMNWTVIVRVAAPLLACVVTYLLLIAIFGRAEWRQLISRESASESLHRNIWQ